MDHSEPRNAAVGPPTVYEFGPFRLDPVKRLLARGGKVVAVPSRTLDVLLVLVQNRGRTLDRDELLRAGWPDTAVEENSLTQSVYTLRKVFGETTSEHRYVTTVPGRGYRFVAPVRELAVDASLAQPTERGADAHAAPGAELGGSFSHGPGARRVHRPTAVLLTASVTLAAIVAVAALVALRSRPAPVRDETRESRPSGIEAVAGNLDAFRHYFVGVQCENEAGNPNECKEHFERALELDPTFALARYKLAVISEFEGETPAEERRAAFASALRDVDRFPMKERRILYAWKAQLDGDDAAALAIYRQLATDYPQDEDVAYLLGEFYIHRLHDRRSAMPWFERTLELDPGHRYAFAHISEILDAPGRRDELLRTVTRLAEMHPGPAAWSHLSVAYARVGQLGPALVWMQRAADAGSNDAREQLAELRMFAGDYTGAQAEYQRLLAVPALQQDATMGLAAVRAYQGRRREALRLLESIDHAAPSARTHLVRLLYVMGEGRGDVVRGEAARLRRLSPRVLYPFQAANLAYAGDLAGAAEIARDLVPGDHHEMVYRAVVQWRTGDASGAADLLRELLAAPGEPSWRLVWFHAEALFDARRFAEAAQALERFGETFEVGYPGFRIQRSWSYPRSLYLLARCHEALGHRREARVTIEKLLAMWEGADPDLPLLGEARALRARLGKPEQGSAR
jgi:eukaryotic-like serine/threonine-protein kinase